jgi:outer membrane protein TolC
MKTKIQVYIIGLMAMFPLINNAQNKVLSLDQALRLAQENNKSLKIKSYEEQYTHEEIKISQANMLPSVNASGNYSYYFDRQVIFMPGTFTGNETEPVVDVAVGGKNTFNTYVTLSQPIVNESARRQIKAAKLQNAIGGLNTKDYKSNLTLEVSVVYLKILLIQESIRLNEQSLKRNNRSLADSRSLYVQGKSLKIDTLRNFILVENLKTTLAHLENQHRVSILHLKQILGLEAQIEVTLSDSLKHDVEVRFFDAVEKSYQEVFTNRPDLQQKQLNIELSRNLLSQNRAMRLPTISLVGAYQIQAQADNIKFESYRWPKTSFVGLQANIPLFSGNRINSKIRQSTIQLEKSELEYADAKDKTETEIATLENNLKEVFQRLTTQQKTVEAAQMNFNIVNDRYQNGLSSRLELSDAELALTEAKMNQLYSIYNVKIAKLQLDKALGVLQY